jgi:membrane protease YdiL (CAAX protease family)
VSSSVTPVRLSFGRTASLHPAARLGAFVLASATAVLVLQGVAYPLLAPTLGRLGLAPAWGTWMTIGALLIGSALAVSATEAAGTSTRERLGLHAAAWRPLPILRATLVGAGAIGGAVLALLGIGWLVIEPGTDGSVAATAGDAAWRLFAPALLEELLVRGYALVTLAAWIGWPAAIAGTSVTFGLLHLANPGVGVTPIAVVTLAGVFLGLVRWRTGSLVAATLAHFAWNFLLVAVAHATVSGLAFGTPGWRLADAGPDWATGGAWGPEGGVFAALGLGAAIALANRWRADDGAAALHTNDPRPSGRTEHQG